MYIMIVWLHFFYWSCYELLMSLEILMVDPTTLNHANFPPLKCDCSPLLVTLNESGSQFQYRAFILHTQDHCMLIYFSARHKNQSSSKSSAHSPPPPPVQPPKPPSPIRAVKLEFQDQEIHKLEKFGKLLAGPNTDLGKNIIFLHTVTILWSFVDLGFYIFRGHKEIELVRYSSHCTPNNLAATVCKFVEL